MDEGAASLRDRDMIARRRGGPFVHRVSIFSLSASQTCVCSSSLSLLVAVPLIFLVARAPERTPVTGPSDLVIDSPVGLRWTRRVTRGGSRDVSSSTYAPSRNLQRNVPRTLLLRLYSREIHFGISFATFNCCFSETKHALRDIEFISQKSGLLTIYYCWNQSSTLHLSF